MGVTRLWKGGAIEPYHRHELPVYPGVRDSPRVAPNDAVAEASQWVRDMRKIEEYKSVRLFMHNTGPAFAVYILAEARDWRGIETGANKLFAARPDFMAKPLKWGGHRDNLLSEIPVQ